MNIPTNDRLIKGAMVVNSAGKYLTTVSNPVPQADLLNEMEQKNWIMVGVPLVIDAPQGNVTYINWKWVSPS